MDHHPDLQRQNAQDIEVTVMAEEMKESAPVLSEAEPLLFPRSSGAIRLDYGHRRNRSADLREEREKAFEVRKTSDQTVMSSSPGQIRKRLSESRGVDLKIDMPSHSDDKTPSSQSIPISTRRQYSHSPPYTSSPIGHQLHHSALPITSDELATIDIRIFFADPHVCMRPPFQASSERKSVILPLEIPVTGGKLADASFLLDEISREYDLDVSLVKESLSIWMESDLLEVQLKPHHCAYEIGMCWQDLLKKFTSFPQEAILDDSPAIVVRRKVQLRVNREMEIISKCSLIREILFNDAHDKFMCGRYTLDIQDSIHLAGLAMPSIYETFIPEKHTVEFLRQEMENFVPKHLVSVVRGPLLFGKAWNGKNNLEATFLSAWQNAPSSIDEIHLQFLSRLQSEPCYGAAFFPGTIEKPKKKWSLSKSNDVKVLVGISHSFISVLEEGKHDNLLIQRIEECTWSRVDIDHNLMNEGVQPSLLLHFPGNDGNTNMLQIFGRLAVMMDALLRAMTALSEEEADSGAEMSDGATMVSGMSRSSTRSTPRSVSHRIPSSSTSSCGSPPNPSPLSDIPSHSTVCRVPSITRSNKLCLATFNMDGRCIHAQGSLKSILKEVTA